jgi:hypothetical protein
VKPNQNFSAGRRSIAQISRSCCFASPTSTSLSLSLSHFQTKLMDRQFLIEFIVLTQHVVSFGRIRFFEWSDISHKNYVDSSKKNCLIIIWKDLQTLWRARNANLLWLRLKVWRECVVDSRACTVTPIGTWLALTRPRTSISCAVPDTHTRLRTQHSAHVRTRVQIIPKAHSMWF